MSASDIVFLEINTSDRGPAGPTGPTGPTGPAGPGANWGAITGTLSAQTDLQTALDAKLSLAGGTLTGGINCGAQTFTNLAGLFVVDVILTGGLGLGGSASDPKLKSRVGTLELLRYDDAQFEPLRLGSGYFYSDLTPGGADWERIQIEVDALGIGSVLLKNSNTAPSADGAFYIGAYGGTGSSGGVLRFRPQLDHSGTPSLASSQGFEMQQAGFIPTVDNTIDLGYTAFRWKDIKLGGVLTWGATATEPMFKRNGTTLEAKLADDSAYTLLHASGLLIAATGNLGSSGAGAGNLFLGTGIRLTDNAGLFEVRDHASGWANVKLNNQLSFNANSGSIRTPNLDSTNNISFSDGTYTPFALNRNGITIASNVVIGVGSSENPVFGATDAYMFRHGVGIWAVHAANGSNAKWRLFNDNTTPAIAPPTWEAFEIGYDGTVFKCGPTTTGATIRTADFGTANNFLKTPSTGSLVLHAFDGAQRLSLGNTETLTYNSLRPDTANTLGVGTVAAPFATGYINDITINALAHGAAGTPLLGFFGSTAIPQLTTAGAEATFVENAGGVTVNDDSTFDGYTLRQVVSALRQYGILQ